MERICLRRSDQRYIVVFRSRILIITRNYEIALKYENFAKNASRILGDIK